MTSMHNFTTLIKRYVVKMLQLPILSPTPFVVIGVSKSLNILPRCSRSVLPKCIALADLVRRLEAATSRLEDMAHATVDPSAATNGGFATAAPGAVLAGTGAQAAPPPAVQTTPPPEPLPQAIGDFDGLQSGVVQKYVSLSESLGGLVAEQVCS